MCRGVADAQQTSSSVDEPNGPWTLERCIEYAKAHNVQLEKARITGLQAVEDVAQQKAGLLPSLSFSTNHNVSWRPWSQSFVNLSSGTMTTTSSEVNYNGSYGLNANLTVWNGGRNVMNIDRSREELKLSVLDLSRQELDLQEQILKLYVQTLYTNEAIGVCHQSLEASKLQRDRARVMVDVGNLAKVDLAQLESQVSQDEYNVVNAQTQLANCKLQLMQQLQLVCLVEDFDVVIPSIDDSKILKTLPPLSDVVAYATSQRPEIQSAMVNQDIAVLDRKIARRAYLPTVNLTAGMGTNNSSGVHKDIQKQWKNNLNNSLGLTISVPILDNRQTKTSVNKAVLRQLSASADYSDAVLQLKTKIENYYMDAQTAQQQYRYAKANVEAMQQSYNLVSEQFKLGLKNIVELNTGKNNLLQAQQQLLESKYTALMARALVNYYNGENIKL